MVEIYLRRDIYRDRRQIKTVEIYRDFRDLSRIFEISRHNRDFFETSGSKNLDKLRNLDREM